MRKMLILLLGIAAFFGGIQGLKINAALPLSSGEVSAELSYNGKSVIFLGDSITYGVGTTSNEKRYTEIVASELGFESMTNYGVSGTLIAEQAGMSAPFVERYSSMTNDADFIFVFGGTNDYWNGTGIIGATTSTNNLEFNGALNNLIVGLKAKYPTGEIIMMTPFKQYYHEEGSSTLNSASSVAMVGYVNAIIQSAVRNGVRYIDLYSHIGFDAELSSEDRTEFTTDGVHLNDKGHRRLANILVSYLQRKLTTIYSSNILDVSTVTSGYYLNNNVLTSTSAVSVSEYFEVSPERSYVIFNENKTTGANPNLISYYDDSQTFISGLIFNETTQLQKIVIVKPPANAKYARLNMTTDKLSLYFVRELYNYDITVSFDTNEGNNINPIEVQMNEKIIVEAPIRTGYNFVGWYRDEALTQQFSIVIDDITEDTTLYAKWVLNTSTGGGSIIIDNAGNFTNIDYIIMGGAALLLIVIFGSKKKKGKWS